MSRHIFALLSPPINNRAVPTGAGGLPKMKITIPTRELYNARINDTVVPVRMWRGRTEDGIEIERICSRLLRLARPTGSGFARNSRPAQFGSVGGRALSQARREGLGQLRDDGLGVCARCGCGGCS
jgi:hypothetical protein